MRGRLIINSLKGNIDVNDSDFDKIYPEPISKKSKTHWSPVKVAKIAAKLLVDKPGVKVLDIGSGVGKFCFIGASLTEGIFTGIEQRKYLAEISNELFIKYKVNNAQVVHGNVLSVDFRNFDAFFFYNPFMENLCKARRIDDDVCLSRDYYKTYMHYVYQQLTILPVGTRIVTYCSNKLEIPPSYCRRAAFVKGSLELWVKERLDGC